MTIYIPITITEEIERQFRPSRLYIKELNGTKYFGVTSKVDIYAYTGSGVVWGKRIKKHGKKNIKTLWVSDWFYCPRHIQDFALMFSEYNNIVESDEWDNKIPENGLTGGYNVGVLMTSDSKMAAVKKRTEIYGNGWGQAHTVVSQEKREATMIEKYGSIMGSTHTPKANETRVATNTERYGGAWGACNTTKARDKAKATRNERYTNGWYYMSEEQTTNKAKALSDTHTKLSAKTLSRPEVVQLNELAKRLNVKLGRGWRSRKIDWLNEKIAELSSALFHIPLQS